MADQAITTDTPLQGEAAEIHRRCRERYPTVHLPPEEFSRRIDEIVASSHQDHATAPPGRQVPGCGLACPACLTLFRQLHHEDLYLAVACARGDRIAWELFADEYYASITRLAASACRSLDAGEDLAQELVTGLLGQGVGAAAGRGESPTGADPNARRSGGKLQSYNGRGSLAAWLRAAIAHAAIDRFRRGQKQVSLDALLEDGRLPEADCNPGAGDADAGLDLRWGPVIASALDDEISRLPARDRLLLKLHHLQGVPLKRIGLQFGVHESTASRWLEKIRQGLRSRLERRLRKSHRLLPRDLRFLWNMIGSDAGAAGEPCRAGPAAKDPPAGTCKTGQPDRQSSKGEL